jgi:two-component system chemotaxis sensor kinase CheA
LAAFHAGGSVHIQISDDGKGLDPEKLIAKAVEKGIISANQRLSNEEAYQLIFAAGFSTAAVVTDISGRGVGMDVVRRNVESLRGRIRIRSEVGRGSTFTIELPLTLAIIDGIQVRVGRENFIIPSLSIVEFVRPEPGSISTALDRGETFAFRDKYLPVFRLSHLYDIESSTNNLCDGALVVVENGTEYVALAVDAILGEYSTVIKNLGAMFADQKGTAGCAIMPDGDISLILDVRSLIELAREVYSPPAALGVHPLHGVSPT